MSVFDRHLQKFLADYAIIENPMSDTLSKIASLQKGLSLIKASMASLTDLNSAEIQYRDRLEIGFRELHSPWITSAEILGFIGIILVIFVVVIYSIGYWTLRACSTIIFCVYPFAALFLTITIMMPTVILAAAFVAIHESCATTDGPLHLLDHDSALESRSVSPIITCFSESSLSNDRSSDFDLVDRHLHRFGLGLEMIGFGLMFPEMANFSLFAATLLSSVWEFVNGSNRFQKGEFECSEWSCAYQPYRDDLCVEMQNGFAFWVFGSFPFMVGLVFLAVSVCLRRRDMRPITIVAENEDDDDPNPELARFALGDFL